MSLTFSIIIVPYMLELYTNIYSVSGVVVSLITVLNV